MVVKQPIDFTSLDSSVGRAEGTRFGVFYGEAGVSSNLSQVKYFFLFVFFFLFQHTITVSYLNICDQ